MDKPSTAEKEGRVEKIATLPVESNLELQAISWSDQPAQRIAVVNGSIIKEGEKIQDYQLQEIKNDEVIFQHRGQHWRLRFQKK